MKLQRDKVLHFAVCAAVALLAAIVIALLSKSFICSAVAGFFSGLAIGVGKEYGDSQAIGNRWNWHDLLADTLGAVTGSAIGGLLACLI